MSKIQPFSLRRVLALLLLALTGSVFPATTLYATGNSGQDDNAPGENEPNSDSDASEEPNEKDGDPINMAKGNFLTRHTDLTVPGPIPLTFARSYDSLRTNDSSMGWKWDHSFNTRLYEVYRFPSTGFAGNEGVSEDGYDPGSARPTAQEPWGNPSGGTPVSVNFSVAPQQLPPSRNFVFYPPVAPAPPTNAEKVAVIIAMATPSGTTRERYTKDASGYISPAGVFHELSDVPGGGYVLRSKHGTTWTFDLDGQLTKRTDRNGNQHTYTRAAEGRVARVSNGGGRFIQLNYDNNGRITTAVDHTGRAVTYTHSSDGDLVKISTPPVESFPEGITRQFTYDVNHNVVTAIDGNGDTYLTNTWDTEGRKVIGQLYAGATCTVNYDFAPNTTRYTDWRGFHTDYEYDDNGNLLTETKHSAGLRTGDPATWVTRHEYNADFKRTKTVYPRGNWTRFSYDLRGNLTEVRSKGINAPLADDPTNDRVRAWTFDPLFNRITSYTDPEGNITAYQLDAAGNTIQVTRPEIPNTTYAYHSNGLGWLTEMTAPDGVVTHYEYFDDASVDGFRYGYLKATVRDFGPAAADLNARSEYAYDDLGNATGFTSPIGQTTTLRYDALRKLVEVKAPAPFSYTSRFTYDGNLRPTLVEQQADAAATTWQSASFEYDLRGLPTRIERQGGEAVVTIDYDDGGLPVLVIDPEGKRSEASYDERGFLLHQTDALDHETRFAFDPNGNLSKLTDANGNATTYDHDRFDRLRRTTYADDTYEAWIWNPAGTLATLRTRAGPTFAYAYDDLHRRTQKVTPEQTYGYTYDDRSRLLTATNQAGTVTMTYDDLGRQKTEIDIHGRTLGYDFDLSGNRTGLTYPDGRTITYEHDELDRLEHIRDANNQPLASFTYDALGRYDRLTHANGTSSGVEFDLRDNLERIRHVLGGTNLDWDYTANLAGVRTAIDAPEGRYDYGYDDTWRLTQADDPYGRTVAYDLDPLGNRETVTENGAATPYVDNALNQYTSVGGQAYTFDANGNLQSDGFRTLVHDSENRLTSVTIDSNGTPLTVTYAYDAFGRRVTRSVNGGQRTQFTYDAWDVLEETYSPSGLRTTYFTGLWIDQPLQKTLASGDTYTFHQDALGSIVAATDASGNLVERYTYDAYGSVTIRGPTGDVRASSSIGNEHFYTARRWDPVTRLYHYRNRDYDPETGRFVQPDPLGYVDGPNVYTYVGSNPLNRVDPTGEAWWSSGLLAVGRAIGTRTTAVVASAVGGRVLARHLAKGNRGGADRLREQQRRTRDRDRQEQHDRSDSPDEGATPERQNYPEGGSGGGANSQQSAGNGNRTRNDPLPRDDNGIPVQESNANGEYTQLGRKLGSKGHYDVGREFDSGGNHVRDVELTDHGRPATHTNPHQHRQIPNPTGGTPQRGPSEPLPE